MITTLLNRAMVFGGLLLAGAALPISAQAPAPHPPTSDSITPALVARGDSIFHGRLAGGTCHVCHGEDAKGTTGLAPDLTVAVEPRRRQLRVHREHRPNRRP